MSPLAPGRGSATPLFDSKLYILDNLFYPALKSIGTFNPIPLNHTLEQAFLPIGRGKILSGLLTINDTQTTQIKTKFELGRTDYA